MEEIDILLKNYIESINTCSIKLAQEAWDTEGSVSFIHPNGTEQGFEEIKNNFYLEFLNKQFSNRNFRIKDIMTKYYGNTALLEFDWEFLATLKDSNKDINTQGKETQFIVLRDKGWKLSNIHRSQKI